MKKNNTVEVFRFIFSMYVVVCHFYTSFAWVYKRPVNGWYAVEFFFVLSGYLLMRSCAKFDGTDVKPWQQAWTVFKAKYVRMLPVWLAACGVYFAGNVVSGAYPLNTLGRTTARNFPVFFMVIESGSFADFGILYSWYIPVMLIAFAVLLPLITANRKRFVYCFAPLITAFLLAYLWHTYGSICMLNEAWVGVTSTWTLRALAEISLGCIAYEVSDTLRRRLSGRVNSRGRLLVTMGGLAGILIPLCWMTFRFPRENQIPALLLLAAGVALMFSELGLFDRMFRGRFWGWLGSYSFALYLGQSVPRKAIDHLWGVLPDKVFFLLYIAVAIAAGLVIHYAAILLVKLWRRVYPLFLRTFFPAQDA